MNFVNGGNERNPCRVAVLQSSICPITIPGDYGAVQIVIPERLRCKRGRDPGEIRVIIAGETEGIS